MSVRISLILEASEKFLSLHMIFSFTLERAAVVWAILERISGFDPLLTIAPRYLSSPLLLLALYIYGHAKVVLVRFQERLEINSVWKKHQHKRIKPTGTFFGSDP